MTEFDNLKRSYVMAIQCAMPMGIGYQQTRHGNDVLHKVCEMFVDGSSYSDEDKRNMKQELELLKESLSAEIEAYYRNC